MASHQQREQWGSKIGFILAAAGSAVGLGNLWKFPYMAGQNGGGAFVLIYFIILFLVGFTLMLAELVLGRHTQLNAIGAYRRISRAFTWVGLLGVLSGFLILSFYSVVGGWVLSYVVRALTGALQTTDTKMLGDMFGALVSGTVEPIVYHGIFMLLTLAIVYGGIGGGIEKASKFMMPALFIMIIILAVRSLTFEGAGEGVRFLLSPDFSKINIEVILNALGQVFFSLSLGMGAMITYGSYLSKDANIPQSSVVIPLVDTGIALLAGLAILPAVFAFGFEPDQGPGLMFVILPAVFAQMPLGNLFAIIFFLLVLFAALTSSISLLEVCVAYVVDEWRWSRGITTFFLSLIIFLMGIPASLSNGPWANIHVLGERGFFDTYDFIASNIFLPLGGLMLCLVVGWFWGVNNAIAEATNHGRVRFGLASFWSFLIRFVAPVAILIVFIRSVF